MNFNFNSEQQQLRDTLQRLIQKDYSFDKRREIIRSAEGWSPEIWHSFADMGLLAISLPEALGGLGGNAVDTLLVMESFGRGMVVEPYLSTVVLGAGLIAGAASPAQQAKLLPAVATGDCRLALAHYEAGGRHELNNVAARAEMDAGGWRLAGSKSLILHGAAADYLLVSARTDGEPRDSAGVSLFLVERKAAGLTLHSYPTQDGHRVADVKLDGVRLGADALIGTTGQALPLIERALEFAIAALCAEAVGNMTALIETTAAYLKTRKQFGVPIGSFQVLQHRMADMLGQVEQARSMAYLAAAKVDSSDAAERRRVIAAAKTLVGQSSRAVGQQAVQLHGGIGVTDELPVSHYFKRLTMINATFGDADHHLARYSELMEA